MWLQIALTATRVFLMLQKATGFAASRFWFEAQHAGLGLRHHACTYATCCFIYLYNHMEAKYMRPRGTLWGCSSNGMELEPPCISEASHARHTR